MKKLKNVSEYTKAILKKEKIYLKPHKKKSYKKIILVDAGFDVLEYYAAMRRYLQWKYKITHDTLEMLYWLYPKGVFTRKDFQQFPIRWGGNRIVEMQEDGLIQNMFPHRKGKIAYQLTRKARWIVVTAHKLLSGETKLPVNPQLNPSFKADASYTQLRSRQIQKDMRELMGKKLEY